MIAHSGAILAAVEDAYRQHFELEPARASITFVGVEPIEVLRFDGVSEADPAPLVHYLSLGMSRYPMTDPAEIVVDELLGPRAELLLTTRGITGEIWRQLAVLAAAPAVEAARYSAGSRVDLGQPLVAGTRCTGGILIEGPLRPIAIDGLSSIELLRLLPATANELAWARVHGSEELIDRWTDAGLDLTDLMRDSVAVS
ncbi:MAG: suppressor of fused domain protein [Jatrophihabitans sp.]